MIFRQSYAFYLVAARKSYISHIKFGLFISKVNRIFAVKRVLAGFVSLPVVNEEPHPKRGLPMDQLVQACGDVVRESVKYYMRPSSESILIA